MEGGTVRFFLPDDSCKKICFNVISYELCQEHYQRKESQEADAISAELILNSLP